MSNATAKPADDPDLRKNWYEHGWAMGAFALGALLIWALGVIPYAYGAVNSSGTLQPSPGGAGLFGDSFGAINALLSALGVAFVALALLKQQAELQHTRRELRETLETNREIATHQAITAASQREAAESQRRATAIETLRIHCDSLQANLQSFSALAVSPHVQASPWSIPTSLAEHFASHFSTELTIAQSLLTKTDQRPEDFTRMVQVNVRRSLVQLLDAIAVAAREQADFKQLSGLATLEIHARATINSLHRAGMSLPETYFAYEGENLERMKSIGRKCFVAHDRLYRQLRDEIGEWP